MIEDSVFSFYDANAERYFQDRMYGTKQNRTNNFTELPAMMRAVGDIADKKLLDVGCGPGIHAKVYAEKGADVKGVDFSAAMVDIAKREVPDVDFQVASVYNLPFDDSSIDIVTASLMVFHLDRMHDAFAEIHRVLKDDGLFCYSDLHPMYLARESVNQEHITFRVFGHVRDTNTGLIEVFGNLKEGVATEYVGDLEFLFYRRMFGTHVRELRSNGFALDDFLDALPTQEFEKVSSDSYRILKQLPPYAVYVARKPSTMEKFIFL